MADGQWLNCRLPLYALQGIVYLKISPLISIRYFLRGREGADFFLGAAGSPLVEILSSSMTA
jgi:hypothetical protein